MNIPSSAEIYAMGQRYSVLTKDEIISSFPAENDRSFLEQDWEKACRFLSAFTDENGICRLDLDSVLDGNTLDYFKNIAVFMIFTALMKNGDMKKLPPQTAIRAVPYISSRMAFAEMSIVKFRKMDDFISRANNDILTLNGSDISVDEVFEKILGYIPSLENFASVSPQDKGRYLPFFEMLYERSRACADPTYSDIIEKYADVLK